MHHIGTKSKHPPEEVKGVSSWFDTLIQLFFYKEIHF